MGAKGIEIREVTFAPFLNGDQSINNLKTSVGTLNKCNVEFDHTLSWETENGELVKVTDISIGATPVFRFELDREDKEFYQSFEIGNRATVDHANGLFNYEGTVQFVSESVLELVITLMGSGGQNGNEGYFGDPAILFRNYQVPDIFELRYNLGRSSVKGYTNFFDGGQQIFENVESDYVIGTEYESTPKTGAVANWKNPQVPRADLERRSIRQDSQVAGYYNERTLLNRYKYRNIDLIVPFFNEKWQENYDEGTIPDEFRGQETLKIYFELKIWLGTEKIKEPFTYEFEQIVEVGWLNENGNGGFSDFTNEGLTYFNTTKQRPSTGLSISDETAVSGRITQTQGDFVVGDSVQITLFKKVDFEEYFESKLSNAFTYLYSAQVIELDNTNLLSRGLIEIQNLNTTITNTKTLDFTFDHTPSNYGKSRLELGDEYILLFTIYNEAGTGLCTAIQLDNNPYEIDTDQLGLIDCLGGRINDPDELPADLDNALNDGYSSVDLWNEDGVIGYWLLRQQAAQNTRIVSLNFRLISNRDSAKNGATDYLNPEDYVLIQEKNIPLEVVGEDVVPIYTGFEQRAFNLADDDIFKDIRVSTFGADPNFRDISIMAAFKIDWQNWVRLQNVPFDFYNPADSFNGYNKRSSNYSQKPSADPFGVRAVLIAEMQNTENEFTTEYAYEIPITVFNYGEDQNTRLGNPADWIGEIITEKEDGTNLNGKVLTTENTVFKIHWVNTSGLLPSIEYWFMHRIEETAQPAFDIWELSTLRNPLPAAPLQPLTGELNVKITSDGAGGYFSECVVDYTKLKKGTSYKLSGRIGKSEEAAGQEAGYSLGYTLGFYS